MQWIVISLRRRAFTGLSADEVEGGRTAQENSASSCTSAVVELYADSQYRARLVQEMNRLLVLPGASE